MWKVGDKCYYVATFGEIEIIDDSRPDNLGVRLCNGNFKWGKDNVNVHENPTRYSDCKAKGHLGEKSCLDV